MTFDIESFIIRWNSTFPYDRLYRKKYKIPFNSELHKSVCQIDAFMDIYEQVYIDKYFHEQSINDERLELYKQGQLLNSKYVSLHEQKAMDAFDAISIDDLDKSLGK